MKCEFVEFYPALDRKVGKHGRENLGTVHVYLIDYKIDLRGIRVVLQRKRFLYWMPTFVGKDEETGEEVRYPVFSFCNLQDKSDLLDFLDMHITPIIVKRLGLKPPGQDDQKKEGFQEEALPEEPMEENGSK